MSETSVDLAVLHGPWRDGSGLQWRIVQTPVGPQAQAQTAESNGWEFVDSRQPAGAVFRRLVAEFIAERDRLLASNRELLAALRLADEALTHLLPTRDNSNLRELAVVAWRAGREAIAKAGLIDGPRPEAPREAGG